MNTFNRLVLILILLGLIFLAVTVVVFTWLATQESIDALDDAVNWLRDNQGDLEKTLISTGAALVAVIAVTLLYMELVPRRGSEVLITDLQSGQATLSTDDISQRVEEAVARVEHVSDVRVRITNHRRGVAVDLDLHVAPEANLAAVTDGACEAARDVLVNRVHVPLSEPPSVRLHYREIRAQRGVAAARRPAAPVTPRPAAATASASTARAPVAPVFVPEAAPVQQTPARRRLDLPPNRTDLLGGSAPPGAADPVAEADDDAATAASAASREDDEQTGTQPGITDSAINSAPAADSEAPSEPVAHTEDHSVESDAAVRSEQDRDERPTTPEQRRRI